MPRNSFAYYVSPEQRRQEVADARERLAQLDAIAQVWPGGFVPGSFYDPRTPTELLLRDPQARKRAEIDCLTLALAGIDAGLIDDPDDFHQDIRLPVEIVALAWEQRRKPDMYEDESSLIDARFGTVPLSAEQARKERATAKRRLRTALKALGV